MTPDEPVVELREVSKWFGPTHSLDRVSIEVRAGEVHVLAGGNGAGKSTLIRVLSGVYRNYGGRVLVAGVERLLHHPEQARRAGIATIHQELPLVGPLSVADNLFLGEPGAMFGRAQRRREAARARDLLQRVGLELDVRRAIESFPLATRQLIEIARALSQHAKLVIFDEPTSALPEGDAERLFTLIAELRRSGTAIIYISHRMEEIYRLGDRITVLRDGRVVLTRPATELSQDELVKAMTGRELAQESPLVETVKGRELLEVQGLSADAPRPSGRRLLENVSFELHAGEILGVAGLQGAGCSELLHALFGDLNSHGVVKLEGQPLRGLAPERAIEKGLMLLPSDRALSVFQELSIGANATLSSLRRFSHLFWVRRAREQRAVAPVLERLALGDARHGRLARELSGGNRQRLALSRCLLTRPRVLLLDEPTRGVDVAAKRDIYRLIRELAAQGAGVIWVASELPELLLLSHRILVLSRGRVAELIENTGATSAALLRAAMNAAPVAQAPGPAKAENS